MEARRGAYIAFRAAMRRLLVDEVALPPPRRGIATSSTASTAALRPSSSSSPLVSGELSGILFYSFQQQQQRQAEERATEASITLLLPFSTPPPPDPAPHLQAALPSLDVEPPSSITAARRRHQEFSVSSIDAALARGQLHSFIAKIGACIERHARPGRTLLPPKSTRTRSAASDVPSPQDLSRWAYRIRDLLNTAGVQASRSFSPTSATSSTVALLANCSDANVLASFALAHIFDAHLALGYALEEGVLAVLLSCLGKRLPSGKDYDEVVRLAFNTYRRAGAQQQQPALPRAMLSAAIVSYGRLSSPGSGEYLLAKVAHDYHGDATPLAHHANLELPLDGWADDDAIWCALVRSRCLAGDLAGAMRWLELYRATSRDETLPQGAKPTKLHDKVYLALMNGVVKADIEAAAPSSASSWWTDWDEDMGGRRMHVARPSRADDHPLEPSTQHTVRATLATMRDDGVRASTAMLNFLVQFKRRCASGGGGGSYLAHHASSPRSSALASHRGAELARLVAEGAPPRASQWDSHRFQEAFDGLASSSSTIPPQQQQQQAIHQRTLRWLLSSLAHLHSRALWKQGISLGESRQSQHAGVAHPTRYLRSPVALRSAFWSALRSSHDIASALYVLRLYSDWGYAHVLRRNEDGEQQQPGFIGEQAVRQWLRDQGYEAARLELFASSTSAAKPRLAIRLLLEEALLESRGLGRSSCLAPNRSDAGLDVFRQKRKEVLSAAIRQVKLEVRQSIKKSKTRRVERRRKEREEAAVKAAELTAREEELIVA